MGTHIHGPILASRRAGPFENMDSDVLDGDTELTATFDDFNAVALNEAFGGTAFWETSGWVLTAGGAVAGDAVRMNSPASAGSPFDSCIRVIAGTAASTGGSMQLDRVVQSGAAANTVLAFPHIWIPSNAASATILDNTILAFACRVGFISNVVNGWDGKAFIGWAETADTSIITLVGTGVITQPETGPLVGFFVLGDGSIRGISQRTVNTAYASGTNFAPMASAASLNAAANTATWFDLGLRMRITDMSDNAANGTTTFYIRKVPRISTSAPGVAPKGDSQFNWSRIGTVLSNQTPNNDLAMVPTIELINGATNQSSLMLDWWAMGISRANR
jgi:hypothetical protein